MMPFRPKKTVTTDKTPLAGKFRSDPEIGKSVHTRHWLFLLCFAHSNVEAFESFVMTCIFVTGKTFKSAAAAAAATYAATNRPLARGAHERASGLEPQVRPCLAVNGQRLCAS